MVDRQTEQLLAVLINLISPHMDEKKASVDNPLGADSGVTAPGDCDVMVSFNERTAGKQAVALTKYLESNGVKTFCTAIWCPEGGGGADWRADTVKGVKQCKAYVPLMTDGWQDSKECVFETTRAVNRLAAKEVVFVPVLFKSFDKGKDAKEEMFMDMIGTSTQFIFKDVDPDWMVSVLRGAPHCFLVRMLLSTPLACERGEIRIVGWTRHACRMRHHPQHGEAWPAQKGPDSRGSPGGSAADLASKWKPKTKTKMVWKNVERVKEGATMGASVGEKTISNRRYCNISSIKAEGVARVKISRLGYYDWSNPTVGGQKFFIWKAEVEGAKVSITALPWPPPKKWGEKEKNEYQAKEKKIVLWLPQDDSSEAESWRVALATVDDGERILAKGLLWPGRCDLDAVVCCCVAVLLCVFAWETVVEPALGRAAAQHPNSYNMTYI
eukprot:SAG22_NODE_2884_length_2125_cov_4.269497_1_plen_440_part_00